MRESEGEKEGEWGQGDREKECSQWELKSSMYKRLCHCK